MQIQAKGGSMVLDFYPIKDMNNNTIINQFLRILTFRGETMNKRIVSGEIMDSEVVDRIDNYGYKVTDYNTIPQLHTQQL